GMKTKDERDGYSRRCLSQLSSKVYSSSPASIVKLNKLFLSNGLTNPPDATNPSKSRIIRRSSWWGPLKLWNWQWFPPREHMAVVFISSGLGVVLALRALRAAAAS